jgi:uncharacterized protein YjiS (DUF1127 family)
VSVMPIPDLPRERSNSQFGVAEAFQRGAVALVTLIARELRVRRDMRRLAELDDTMLRDIGIARTEIERAVRVGR